MDIKKLTESVEIVSSQYAKKFNIRRDRTWFILKLQEELGEFIQAFLMLEKQARQKNKSIEEIRKMFDQELADILCQTLLCAKHFNVDLDKTVEEKWLKYLDAKKSDQRDPK